MRSSEIFRDPEWQFVTVVPGQTINPIFQSQAVREEIFLFPKLTELPGINFYFLKVHSGSFTFYF